MAEPKQLQIPFPLSGVSRRTSLARSTAQDNPTAPWSVNCRPEDPLSSRLRGGSRLGLTAFTGDTFEYPTGEIVSETDEPIWTEDGDETLVDTMGAQALYIALARSLEARGIMDYGDDLVASVGTAPLGYQIGCIYRDRLVVSCISDNLLQENGDLLLLENGDEFLLEAGESNTDHLVYMSRQGDYTDWDYGADAEDTGRAFLFQCSEAGEIGERITALISHRDAFLIVGTDYGLWILEGDPASSGALRNISRNVGIVSSTAWTIAGDTIFFLSHDGLYSVQANGSGLKDMSGDKLPVELSDVDTSTVSVILGYNHNESGIYIFLTGGTYHWYFDLNFGGFWPFKLPSANDPSGVFTSGGEMVLWDGSTGFWTVSGTTDVGTSIQSHVLLGPFQVSTTEYSMLASLHGTIQLETGGTMTWRTIVGTTAEQVCQDGKDAIDAYVAGNTTTAVEDVVHSGTWVSGRQVMAYPRTRGMWIVLWLSSSHAWAFENLFATTRTLGRWRG